MREFTDLMAYCLCFRLPVYGSKTARPWLFSSSLASKTVFFRCMANRIKASRASLGYRSRLPESFSIFGVSSTESSIPKAKAIS